MRIAIRRTTPTTAQPYLPAGCGRSISLFDVFDFERGDARPSLSDYAGLAILGGVMSVNDDLPSLRQAEVLIRRSAYRPQNRSSGIVSAAN